MKMNETFENIVRHDLDNNSIPMLVGEPGIGKSSWVESLARNMKTKSFTLACNQLADKSDLTGARLIEVTKTDKNGKTIKTGDYTQAFFPHVVITQAINYALEHPDETPILFLDELNRTTSDVTSEALSIPTMRSIGNRKLPNNLKIITAGNDKGNVVSLDTASISRFVPYHVEPDIETFFAVDPHLNADIKAVLIKHPEYIFQKPLPDAPQSTDDDDDDDEKDESLALLSQIDDGDKLSQITTPRTITSLSNWLNSYDDSTLQELVNELYTNDEGKPQSLLMDIIEAHTGNTPFSIALCEEIADRVNRPSSQNTQSNSVTIKKPAEFDKLKNAGSIQELDDTISNLNEKQLENNFVYALFNKENNSNIIKELVQTLPDRLSASATTTLMKLGAAGRLHSVNIEYLCGLDNPTARNLAMLGQI